MDERFNAAGSYPAFERYRHLLEEADTERLLRGRGQHATRSRWRRRRWLRSLRAWLVSVLAWPKDLSAPRFLKGVR